MMETGRIIKRIAALIFGCAILFLSGCVGGNKIVEATNGEITGVHFTYDHYTGDQFYLDANVKKINASGAKADISKRVGPNNYTGFKKEGKIKLDENEVKELLDILGRYDLEAFTNYHKAGIGYSPTRTLIVFSGDNILYDVAFDTVFPETLPPEEDIMYAELYNFFNDLVAEEPGWEEVVNENLPDPRDNPAYGERTVTWFGNEVRLVPGTGTFYEDGSYADIDYKGKDWWVEEGFVGEWVIDTEKTEYISDASLKVNEDGTVLLTVDGKQYDGKTSEVRRYNDSAGVVINIEGNERGADVVLLIEESYERIRFMCMPDPVPGFQFSPIDVYFDKK